MTIDAENLFNDLGATYEDAFADDPKLSAFTRLAATKLPPSSRVLDVGCGTGKPVAHELASAGLDVHGIDASDEMVRIAGSQVRGNFQQADMREYKPKAPFDGVFAILSLFQLSPGDIYIMMFKFSEWLNVGGFVVLGVTPSTSLDPEKCVYDPTWDAVWMIGKLWMNNYTNESFLSEEGWCRLLRTAGFVLEVEPVSYLFCPTGLNHPEAHYLLIARKVERQPLLGPYPLPIAHQPLPFGTIGNAFTDRLVSKDLEALMVRLEEKEKVLSLVQGHKGSQFTRSGVQSFGGPIENLPFSSGTFDVVLAPWQLDYITDLGKALQEMIHVSNRTHSQLVIIQGAPGNEAVKLLNAVARSLPIGHQGRLLHSAMRYLAEHGYGNISLRRMPAHYEFPEQDVSERCIAAAELLAGLWHAEHPQYEVIKQALVPKLQLHFKGNAHSVGHEMVVLVANPTPN